MSNAAKVKAKPTLVVGATGQVGRRVVAQLLQQNKPVRALVRNPEKAKQIFGDDLQLLGDPNLQIIVTDLSEYQEHADVLEKAVQGCDCIISVSGALRFSKLTDFLPWRLMNPDVSSWADTSHPYFCNYQAHCLLIDLAKQHSVKRFVRLTGGTVGFSAFNPFVILMSGMLSMTTRYHFLTENYLRESTVPYMIVRPGGLMNDERVSAIFVHAPPWRPNQFL
jgi:NAD(P)-dependent dehydrogenase (short-subunit alcohol dehydrogenase family)